MRMLHTINGIEARDVLIIDGAAALLIVDGIVVFRCDADSMWGLLREGQDVYRDQLNETLRVDAAAHGCAGLRLYLTPHHSRPDRLARLHVHSRDSRMLTFHAADLTHLPPRSAETMPSPTAWTGHDDGL
jgi:hypothetical protein